jgi:hypothetical protein
LYHHGSHFNKNICIRDVSQNLKLANLNGRPIRKPWSGRGTSSGANPETRGEHGNQERSEGGEEFGGIRGFLVRALLRVTLTLCVLQMSTGPLWYSNFQVLNRAVTDLAS